MKFSTVKNLRQLAATIDDDPSAHEMLLVFDEPLRDRIRSAAGIAGYWNKDHYLEFWPISRIKALNESYAVHEHLPGFTAFGSDGIGNIILFSNNPHDSSVFTAPFIGMGKVGVTRDADSLESFLAGLGEPDFEKAMLEKPELVEIKPILFGGDPVDPSNKTWLSRTEHIKFVQFWNRQLAATKVGGPR